MSDPGSAPGGNHPSRRERMLGGLRRDAGVDAGVGERAADEVARATRAEALEVVPTRLEGSRALVGHVLGMHRSLPAGHLHGPREVPVLLYLFADGLAIRPTDDAPMSSVPVLGLHMLLPPLAVARWVYKAGRIEHANLDLMKDAQRFADSLATWTIDDFAAADEKLDVHRTTELSGPIHVYEHLGFAHVWVPPHLAPSDAGAGVAAAEGTAARAGAAAAEESASKAAPRLKSALPASSEAFVKLWQLFALVQWPEGLRTDVPHAPPTPSHP
ncbi:MAG: hypothetical protein M0Z46_00855 [Actinomycetota bacterium]|nr:hypothetical protein [Actinomycetota bacterium]